MTRLRLGLSHLREHKFNHNFQNCSNPLCSCGMDIESKSHFFLHCPLFDAKRITLLNTLNKIDCKLIETNESSLIGTLLFSNSLFELKKTPLMMMMNCFCGMVDRRKAFSLISSRDHCQRSLSSWISDTPWAGFEPAQNQSSG